MALPQYFLSPENFQLAFDRIVRGQNPDYKRFYRPFIDAYSMSAGANLADVIKDIRKGRYRPQRPTMVYIPKKSGVLRPLALLSLKDLIVYQAIVNCMADRFFLEQQKLAGKRTFGAVYSGPDSRYFFKSWSTGYKWFNTATAKAFHDGQRQLAEFDLVSFYELINHDLLCDILSKKVRNKDLLEFLKECLRAWTASNNHGMLSHGIPQGPEASAFLAECVLISFDLEPFEGITYLRYIDDIRLLCSDSRPLRRALVKLDLLSKSLGLVPQAQKIEVKTIESLSDVQKTVPSLLPILMRLNPLSVRSQEALHKMLDESISGKGEGINVVDMTAFKYSLSRLKPNIKILKRIAELLILRPDCSSALSIYLRKFPKNKTAAEILFRALEQDPIFDAVAADYIEALDVCQPTKIDGKFNAIVKKVEQRSLEKSVLLRSACLFYRLSRLTENKAVEKLSEEKEALVKTHLIQRLFGAESETAPFDIAAVFPILKIGAKSADEEYARFCAATLADHGVRKLPANSSFAANLLFNSLGLTTSGSKKPSVVKQFFKEKHKLDVSVDWKRALGKDLSDVERRCIRAQRLESKDPTAHILMVDTLNEVLIQRFSKKHPGLSPAYKLAAGKNKHPDFGNWLTNGSFVKALPKAATWFQRLHNARVKADLAHAKQKGGKAKGMKTNEISWGQANSLMRESTTAYQELLTEWASVL